MSPCLQISSFSLALLSLSLTTVQASPLPPVSSPMKQADSRKVACTIGCKAPELRLRTEKGQVVRLSEMAANLPVVLSMTLLFVTHDVRSSEETARRWKARPPFSSLWNRSRQPKTAREVSDDPDPDRRYEHRRRFGYPGIAHHRPRQHRGRSPAVAPGDT